MESPFWQAKFRNLEGKPLWLTTKQRDYRKAMAVADRWEEAVRLAERWELNQLRAQRIADEIWKVTKTLPTQRVTERLLSDLLSNTIGEELAGQDFEKFCLDWLADKKASRTTAESTLKRYRAVLDGFLAHLPEKRRRATIGSITTIEVERFRNSEIDAGKSAVSANFGIKVLRALFNTARRQGVISSNPAEAAELLPEEPEERKPFNEEQVKALLATAKADSEWRGMILFGYHAGLRLTDASSLTWDSYDPVNHSLTFRAKKTGKRTRKDTVIALHSDIVNYLDSLPVNDVVGQPVFPSLVGRESGSHGGLSNAFNRLIEKAGIRVASGIEKQGKGRRVRNLSFHSLRHSFVSRLANSEVSPDVRKSLVGHSSDQVHRRYVHLDLALQKKAIEKLGSVVDA